MSLDSALQRVDGFAVLAIRRGEFTLDRMGAARRVSERSDLDDHAIWRKSQYSNPDRSAAAGKVNTHPAAMLRTVRQRRPLPFAAIVPATPELRMCVVLTGSPKAVAAKIVAAATSSRRTLAKRVSKQKKAHGR